MDDIKIGDYYMSKNYGYVYKVTGAGLKSVLLSIHISSKPSASLMSAYVMHCRVGIEDLPKHYIKMTEVAKALYL